MDQAQRIMPEDAPPAAVGGQARRGGRLGRIGLGAFLLGAAGFVVVMGIAVPQMFTASGTSLPSRPVYPEPLPGADPVIQADGVGEALPPLTGQPLQLAIPALDFHATVGSMPKPYSGRIDPPTPGSAYWIRDYGLVGPDSGETAYIAGHTFRGVGDAVFNPLFDRSTRNVMVGAGDALDVQTVDNVFRYTITAVARYDKTTVEQQQELWQNVPGRLVIVACQYNGDSSSTENLVIYAQLGVGVEND